MNQEVLGILEAREALPRLVRDFASNPTLPPVLIGSHRKAQIELRAVRSPVAELSIDLLRTKARIISSLAKAHNLSTVSVFGSVAKGTNRENSDLDLLCDGNDQTTLYDIAGFEMVMEDLLQCSVTVLTRDSLDKKLDKELIDSAIKIC